MAPPVTASEPERAPGGHFELGDKVVPPGTRLFLELPVARLFTGNQVSLPVTVLNGVRPGPRLWLDAAIHGDELNGVEIIRRVLEHLDPEALAGVVVAVPIVNVFGFLHQDRYLPDRRDLNRSFPGSPKGSLAARIAHLFTTEVVERCQIGIDLHTGSHHRTNLPQVRGNLTDEKTRHLAETFGAPIHFHSRPARGTLRNAALRRQRTVLLYEGGEPLRFDPDAIEMGVAGVLRVLRGLGMWQGEPPPPPSRRYRASDTRWLRAPRSGIFHLDVELGQQVGARQILGQITDPFNRGRTPVRSGGEGLVIGFTNNPLVYQGGALVHLARGIVPVAEDPPEHRGE